ncbi:MAG: transport-associated protein [Gemmatimonadetes bacterium]|nr:transport-associated protein [Gemmatimonadota bacterium]
MARDLGREFGGGFDFATMSDDEIYDVVMEQLREQTNVDVGWLEVSVREGRVTLAGSVGSDGDAQVAEQLLTDSLGLEVVNELVVDELHRQTLPEAVDDSLAAEDEIDDEMGQVNDSQSDTAEHLVADLESETYGTHDVGTAIEEGTSYMPPDGPIAEGYESREDH